MTEITFLVQEAEEGGYTARALGKSIFTEGNTMLKLKSNIKKAILCYFGDVEQPFLLKKLP
jgi:predicted RNase H-like HicB family nuclease